MQPAFKMKGYTVIKNNWWIAQPANYFLAWLGIDAESNSAPILSLPQSPHLKGKFQASVGQLPQAEA